MEEVKVTWKDFQTRAWRAFEAGNHSLVVELVRKVEKYAAQAGAVYARGEYPHRGYFAVVYFKVDDFTVLGFPAEIPTSGDWGAPHGRDWVQTYVGEYPTYDDKGEAIASLFIPPKEVEWQLVSEDYITNQCGGRVLNTRREVARVPAGYLLREIRLVCTNSADLSLGNCSCVSHEPYREYLRFFRKMEEALASSN